MESKISKYAFVDALRGWAILGVIFFHTAMFWTPPTEPFVALVARQGARGVQLFLVISAFALFLSMDSRRSRESRPVTNFFIRRFFRIAPLFYLAIGIYLSITGFAPNVWAPKGIHWWFLPVTVLFLHAWIPEAINSIVPGGWTIGVEAVFYALLPFLYLRLKNVRSTVLFITLSLLASKYLSDLAGYLLMPRYPGYEAFGTMYTSMWFFTQAPLFGFGILTYHLFKKYRHQSSATAGNALLALSLVILFLPLPAAIDILPWQLYSGIAFCLLLLSLHLYPNRILVNSATQWLGKISYSLYLAHLLVMNALDRLSPANSALRGPYGFYLVFAITLTLSSALSLITYRIIEVPGMGLGRSIIGRLENS